MGELRWPSGWTLEAEGNRVATQVETDDFLGAVRLLEAISEVAEELEHHPDFHLTGYNHVRIVTYSHDVGHLTERDEKLAQAIQRILEHEGLARAASKR